jgi:predicted DNA binding CopG/RHH family protein
MAKQKRVCVSIPPDLMKELKKHAKANGMSFANFLFSLILQSWKERKKIGGGLADL